jgi:hypothetical protein
MEALLVGPFISPSTRVTTVNSAFDEPQFNKSSILGDSRKDSKEGSDEGELLCLEAS